MKGELIPDSDHASRHVSATSILSDGRVSGQAFRRRAEEDYLSINWVEYFGQIDRSDALREVRNALLAKGRAVGKNSKFAVINIGHMARHIKNEANMELHVKHEPTPKDPSHAGIFNMPKDDSLIGSLIAQIVGTDAIYPAQ